MSVYEYRAKRDDAEHHIETGRIVAQDKIDAFDKLKRRGLTLVSLKKLEGLAAFFQAMTANIR